MLIVVNMMSFSVEKEKLNEKIVSWLTSFAKIGIPTIFLLFLSGYFVTGTLKYNYYYL